LVSVPAAHDLVRKIDHAVANILPGMGQDLLLMLVPQLATGIAENVSR
jgi:hypothetical protein